MRAEVTDGTVVRFTDSNDAACATQHSFSSGLEAVFVGNGAKGAIELVIANVTEGETGGDYPTRLELSNGAGESWKSDDCLTSITEHELLRTEETELGEFRIYRVVGEGRCAEPLGSVTAGGNAAVLDSFAFHAEFTWRG